MAKNTYHARSRERLGLDLSNKYPLLAYNVDCNVRTGQPRELPVPYIAPGVTHTPSLVPIEEMIEPSVLEKLVEQAPDVDSDISLATYERSSRMVMN